MAKDLLSSHKHAALTGIGPVDLYSNNTVKKSQYLLIAADKIIAIASSRQALIQEIGSDVTLDWIDGHNMCCLPGLVDGHAHITGGGGEQGFSSKIPAPFLSDYILAGVTTVIGVLGTDDTTRSTESLLAQVYALREEGLNAFCHTGGYHFPATTLTGSIKKDIAFLPHVVGLGELAIADHRASQISAELLAQIASDVHVAGLMSNKPGVVHLHLGDGKEKLKLVYDVLDRTPLPAKLFHPTHVNRNQALLEDALLLAKKGCTIDFTAFPTDENSPMAQKMVSITKAVGAYFYADLPISQLTISSDGGGCLPCFDHTGHCSGYEVGSTSTLMENLRALLDAGYPLERVLPFFTANPASFYGFHNKGNLVEGADADLLLCEKEGLGLNSVMVNGKWLMKSGELLARSTFETDKNIKQ